MARTKSFEVSANFALHAAGTCSFCDHDAPELCAAFQLFVYSGGTIEAWKGLRSFIVPGTGRYMGRTVWQLVCADARITDIRGGKFSDGSGEAPTPKQVLMAIAAGAVNAVDD